MDKNVLAYLLRVDSSGQRYQGHFEEIENSINAVKKFVLQKKQGYLKFLLLGDITVFYNSMTQLPVNRALIYKEEILEIFKGNILCVRRGEQGGYKSVKEEDKDFIEEYIKPINLPSIGLTYSVVDVISANDLPEWKGDK